MKKRKMQDISVDLAEKSETTDMIDPSTNRPSKKMMIYLPKDEYINLLIKSHRPKTKNDNIIIKILKDPNHPCFPFFETFTKVHLQMLIGRIFNDELYRKYILEFQTYRIPDLNHVTIELIVELHQYGFIPDFKTLFKFINKYLLVKKQLSDAQANVLLKCMSVSTNDGQLYEHQIRRLIQFNKIKFMSGTCLPISKELENEKKIFIEFLDLCSCRISKNYKSLSYLIDVQRFPYLCFLQTDHWWKQTNSSNSIYQNRSNKIIEKHKKTYHDILDEIFPTVLIPIVKNYLFF